MIKFIESDYTLVQDQEERMVLFLRRALAHQKAGNLSKEEEFALMSIESTLLEICESAGDTFEPVR